MRGPAPRGQLAGLTSQAGKFRFGLNQNRNVRIGIFPNAEKLFIGLTRFSPIARECVSARESQIREREKFRPQNDAAVAEDFLKLRRGFGARLPLQICLTTKIDGEERSRSR